MVLLVGNGGGGGVVGTKLDCCGPDILCFALKFDMSSAYDGT